MDEARKRIQKCIETKGTKLDLSYLGLTVLPSLPISLRYLYCENTKLSVLPSLPNSLKELLNVTDGNLASHIAGLEKNEYIKVIKEFVGKKPKTSFTATPSGKKAFKDHLTALENLLNQHN